MVAYKLAVPHSILILFLGIASGTIFDKSSKIPYYCHLCLEMFEGECSISILKIWVKIFVIDFFSKH